YGKWEQKKQQLLGMKVLTQAEDGFSPVYHLTAGMKQSNLVKAIQSAFDSGLLADLKENLPDYLLEKYRLMSRQE
ncbi:hypothetical protein JVW19_24375, partial [Vibrio cholerae O1]|nr:hypothetical protein [Vibrio cholerae O1]